MKLIGIAHGVFTHKDTGEVTKVIDPKENHIQDFALNATAEQGGFAGQILVITDMTLPEQTRVIQEIVQFRTGNVIVGLPNNENTYAFEPGIHLYRTARQFDPPVADYTITAAAILSNTDYAKALVVFDTPCIQTTNEILTLYYQVQVRYDEDWFTNPDENVMTEREAWFLHSYMLSIATLAQPATYSNAITTLDPRKIAIAQQSQTMSSSTNLRVEGTMRAGIRADYDIADNIGQLLTSIATTSRAYMYDIENVPNSPVQGIFSHNSAAVKPFYDAPTAASGTGGLAVVADANYEVQPMAEYVKITITNSGQNNIASYKYSVRSSTGFDENTFTPRFIVPPALSPNNTYITKGILMGDVGQTTPTIEHYYFPIPYDKYVILMVHLDRIFILNTVGLDATALDSDFIVQGDVDPRFLPTDITDVKVTAAKGIWVACKDTGLYFVSADLLTLNVFDSASAGLAGVTGCSGVDVGFAGRVWAYFQHATNTGIYYSDNNGTSWTYTNSGVVGTSADNVALFADPSTVDGHLLLVYAVSDDMWGRWWNNSTTTNSNAGRIKSGTQTVVPQDSSQLFSRARVVAVSPNGVWATSNYYNGTNPGCLMEFGTLNRSGSAYDSSDAPVNVTTDKDGNYVFLAGANGNYGPSLITEVGGLTILNLTQQRHLIHLTDGIWLVYNQFNFQDPYYALAASSPNDDDNWGSSPFRQFIWKDYGWDGSSWIRDFAGSKATHTAAEELMTGVTVAFNDNGGAIDSYVDTDTYTFGLYDGVWMDGSTSFSFDTYMFTKPTEKQTSVEVGILPAVLVNNPHTPWTPTVPTALWTDKVVQSGDNLLEGRTLDAKLICTVNQYIDNNKIYLHNENDIKASATLRLYSDTFTSQLGYFGISRATSLGEPFDVTAIPFGLEVIAGGAGHIIRAWQDGVLVGSIDHLTKNAMFLRITITNKREIVMEAGQLDSWYLVYKSPINTVILSDYHLEFKTNRAVNPGTADNCYYYAVLVGSPSNYIYLGNGLNEGAFATDFYRIDDKILKIFIDGIEAVNVGNDNTASVLAANSYSLFPFSAMLRFSPSDVGKTITAEYITITDT